MNVVVRIALAVFFSLALAVSLIPIPFGIRNIGVVVTVGGFAAALLITVFWKSFCRLIKAAYTVAFLKWTLSIVFVLLGIMLLFAIIISIMMLCSINNAKPQSSQTVIVLGCEVRGDRPSRMLANRLNTAYTYLCDNPDSLCIVSGGQGEREKKSEAQAMKEYLTDKGIDESRIIMEDKSTSTFENLEFSKAIMDEKNLGSSAVIVTDGFHEWRAQYIAKKVGIDASGCGAAPYYPFELCYWVREIFGIVRVVAFGY